MSTASSRPQVHSTAVIEPGASLAPGVVVGPYCVVGSRVTLARDVRLHSHVVVEGNVRLGAGCTVFPFAVVGGTPQDLKYQGEDTDLVVGEQTIIREHVTLHRGTAGGGGTTRIGARCLLMAGTHVAHDCQLADRVILANGAALGGHVEIGQGAVLGAAVGVHQFARVGELAMVGAGSMLSLDAPPFCLVQGDRARLMGLNLIGLRRAGWSNESVRLLRRASRALLRPGAGEAAAAQARAEAPGPSTERLIQFLSTSQRGVCRFR